MSDWRRLHDAHGKVRVVGTNLLDALRGRLVQLASRGHCDRTIQGRFTYRKRAGGPNGPLDYMITPDGQVPLRALPELPVAKLALLAKVDARRTHLHQFTAMIEGTTIKGAPWATAIHLEDDAAGHGADRKGTGACGHAVLHCHVGPTLDDEPKVRTPFPAVSPAAALDWLLTVVLPDWEPAPW